MMDLYRYHEAEIVERIQESRNIFTLRLSFTDPAIHNTYRFSPGQFNMLYMFGLGEVPISIVSDPEHDDLFDHTIRQVGRITNAMANLKEGDKIGVRGPYGRGWPMQECKNKNVVMVTGGLGCAPAVSVIHYILNRRDQYKQLSILQGVKKSSDLIWRKQYEQWEKLPNTQVLLAADVAQKDWKWTEGPVIQLFDQANIQGEDSIAMMCGPEPMMIAAANELSKRNFPDEGIWLSLERNMQCAIGQCGHCQYGQHFVCRDGPVFPYSELKHLVKISGF
jgi:NAD(P)H-flavin reductase